jgi:hypothetical protein
VCWLKFCGLLDYNVISLASGLSSSQNGLACLGPEVAAEGAKARGFDFAEPAVEGGVDGEEGKC